MRKKKAFLLPHSQLFLPILLLLVALACPGRLNGQVSETFADSNLTQYPSWENDHTRWALPPFADDYALRSNGLARHDTLTLVTRSQVFSGSWRFLFRYTGVNLSNFNGTRFYLLANTTDLKHSVYGYYLQLGVNNSDRIALYRQNGAPDRRTLLGTSADGILPGDTGTVVVEITRDAGRYWSVQANNTFLFETSDSTYQGSQYTGLWLKHSPAANQAFWFDDIVVTGATDNTAPVLEKALYVPDQRQITVTFSEPLDPLSVNREAFQISPTVGYPDSIGTFDRPARSIDLHLPFSLAPNQYQVTAPGVTDLSGHPPPYNNSVGFTVVGDTVAPRLVEVQVQTSTQVTASFSEKVYGCSPQTFNISGGIGYASVTPCDSEGSQTFTLQLNQPLNLAELYTLTASGLRDASGYPLARRSLTFVWGDLPPPPAGAVVVNELLYDPPSEQLEFIELYNRSKRPVDLRILTAADSRGKPGTVKSSSPFLQPAGYAVLTADTSAFNQQFPNAESHLLTPWPTLNNGGDAVVLAADSVVVDSLWYDGQWGTPDLSLERLDPAGRSTPAQNWEPSRAVRGATPGLRNSVFRPDTTAPRPLFAEQIANRRVTVYFSEALDTTDLKIRAVQCGSKSQVRRALSLPDAKGLELLLAAAPTGPCQFPSLRDLQGNLSRPVQVPLAYLPRSGDLLINELMYEPFADPHDGRPDQVEYVELYNGSDKQLTLHRMYWTNKPDENNRADTLFLPDTLAAVRPGGLALVYAAGSSQASPLAKAFPDLNPQAELLQLLPVSARSLKLSNNGQTVRLHAPNHQLVDQITYQPSWHHPDLIDSRGIALERILPQAASNSPHNWSSSAAAAGGTPGRRNSLHSPLPKEPSERGIVITPTPFSPDGDGYDDTVTISYVLSNVTASLRVRIFDARGHLVRTLTEARLSARSGRFLWDGLDDQNAPLPVGIYVVLLEAVNASGGTVETYKAPVVLARPF